MEKAYLNKSLVLLGGFKPVNFDKLFLVKSGLVQEGDFQDDSVFLPDYAQISTPRFLIHVNPDRVNIGYKDPSSVLDGSKVSRLFSDSTVKALGVNFKKALILDRKSRTKDFFYFEENILNQHFDDVDTVYGYFASREFPDYRLTLNIKPVKLPRVDDPKVYDALDFRFNFRFGGDNALTGVNRVSELEEIANLIIEDYDRVDG